MSWNKNKFFGVASVVAVCILLVVGWVPWLVHSNPDQDACVKLCGKERKDCIKKAEALYRACRQAGESKAECTKTLNKQKGYCQTNFRSCKEPCYVPCLPPECNPC